MPEAPLQDNQWLLNAFNGKRIIQKTAGNLHGIILGMLADAEINDTEIAFLYQWMKANAEHMDAVGEYVWQKLNDILEDGIVTQPERKQLLDVLTRFVGGQIQDKDLRATEATTLPIDSNASIVIPSKVFCFTGQFYFGKRSDCHAKTEELGGLLSDTVKKNVDYLVIGSLVSKSWANTSYGRKIEQALELKSRSLPVQIITEDMWSQQVVSLN